MVNLLIFEKIRNAAVKILKSVFASGNLKTNFFDDIQKFKTNLSQEETVPEMVKIALCYQEISRETLSFNDLVSLVKTSFTSKSGVRICVLKTNNEKLQRLDIMACDDKNDTLFSPETPWLQVNVAQLEPDLLQIFGDKNMIVLK